MGQDPITNVELAPVFCRRYATAVYSRRGSRGAPSRIQIMSTITWTIEGEALWVLVIP